MVMGKRVIRGNSVVTTAEVNLPDQFANQMANSMAIATNTFSPMAVGVHGGNASPKGFVGDPGFGVNRFAGRTLPQQHFAAVTAPVVVPNQYNIGLGAGVAGQPGLPGTGTVVNSSLAWMSAHQLGYGLGR